MEGYQHQYKIINERLQFYLTAFIGINLCIQLSNCNKINASICQKSLGVDQDTLSELVRPLPDSNPGNSFLIELPRKSILAKNTCKYDKKNGCANSNIDTRMIGIPLLVNNASTLC